MEQLFMRPKDVAVALDVKVRTAYSMLNDGRIPGVVRIGEKTLRVSKAIFDAWVRQQTVQKKEGDN